MVYFAVAGFAQTENEQKVEQAVTIYNGMTQTLSDAKDKLAAQAIVSDLMKRRDEAISLLDAVIANESSELKKTAQYFKTNARYKVAYAQGFAGFTDDCLVSLNGIESDMNSYNSTVFPLRYKKEDKNFIIKWEDFSPTQVEYWSALAELSYLKKNYQKVITYAPKVVSASGNHTYFRALAGLLFMRSKDKTATYDQDFAEQTVTLLHNYNLLTPEQFQTWLDFKYETPTQVYAILDRSIKANTSLGRNGYYYGKAAGALAKAGEKTKAAEAYGEAIRTGNTDRSFLTETADFAVSNNDNYLLVNAADALAKSASDSDCDLLEKLGGYYQIARNSKKANDYGDRAEKCKKKAARSARKYSSSGGGSFNFYTGAYIIPLLTSNMKRDYGGVANFVFRKSAWEFSYLKVRYKKENVFDLSLQGVDAEQDNISRWDGYYAHVHPKFFTGKYGNDGLYAGILLGYAEKNFRPLQAQVINHTTAGYTEETFEPKAKQYIAMFNMGGMFLAKGFGFDMYYGVGAAYGQWDIGKDQFKGDQFEIQNPVLQNRKDKYWAVLMRLGFTMGINWGRGRK